MLRTAVSYKPIKLGSTYTSVERLKVRVSFSRKTQIISNNMEKLPDLKELPKNMLEIKEDRSEISLQDLIDNFYT